MIRDALADDLDAIEAVERAAMAHPWTRRQLEEDLRITRVFEEGGRVVGHAVTREVAGERELLEIAVDPALWGRGIGAALLADSRAHLLEVRADNERAIALYSRAGFVAVGRRRAYYPDGADAVLMSRPGSP